MEFLNFFKLSQLITFYSVCYQDDTMRYRHKYKLLLDIPKTDLFQ